MVGQLAGDDVGQQPRTGQAFIDSFGRFRGNFNLPVPIALLAPAAVAVPASVLCPQDELHRRCRGLRRIKIVDVLGAPLRGRSLAPRLKEVG